MTLILTGMPNGHCPYWPYVSAFRNISFLCNDNVKKILYYSYFNSNEIYLLTIRILVKQENIDEIAKYQYVYVLLIIKLFTFE